MSDVNIGELAAQTNLADTDIMHVRTSGGVDRHVTGLNVKNEIQSHIEDPKAVDLVAGEALAASDPVGIGVNGKLWKLGWSKFAESLSISGYVTSVFNGNTVASIGNSRRFVTIGTAATNDDIRVKSWLINDGGTISIQDTQNESGVTGNTITAACISPIYAAGYFIYFYCNNTTNLAYWRIGQVSDSTGLISWINAQQNFAAGTNPGNKGHLIQVFDDPEIVICHYTRQSPTRTEVFCFKYDGATPSKGANYTGNSNQVQDPQVAPMGANLFTTSGANNATPGTGYTRFMEYDSGTLVITALSTEQAFGSASTFQLTTTGLVCVDGHTLFVNGGPNSDARIERLFRWIKLNASLEYRYAAGREDVSWAGDTVTGILYRFIRFEKSQYSGLISRMMAASTSKLKTELQISQWIGNAEIEIIPNHFFTDQTKASDQGPEVAVEIYPGVWVMNVYAETLIGDEDLYVYHMPTFLGYPDQAYTAGQTVRLRTSGVITGLSGIIPGKTYFHNPLLGEGLHTHGPWPVAIGMDTDRIRIFDGRGR